MVGRRSSLQAVEMRTLSGKLREETVCLVLRVKLKLHSDLPYNECEEFLKVMSMDQRAGVWACGRREMLEQQWSSSS